MSETIGALMVDDFNILYLRSQYISSKNLYQLIANLAINVQHRSVVLSWLIP